MFVVIHLSTDLCVYGDLAPYCTIGTKVTLKSAVLFEDTVSAYIQGLSSIIIYICMSGIAHDMKCRLQFLVF